MKVTGHRGLVTVVGSLPEVRAGEWREANGSWTVAEGMEFRHLSPQ